VVLPSNVGVSRGRNVGIATSTGRYVMVLDDDAEVLRDGLALLDFADKHPRAAVIGPRIVDSHDELMFTCRRFPTLVDKLSRRVDTEWGRRALADSEFRDWDHAQSALVDYVIGACQLLRRDALDEIGSYDPSSFYGPEDVDLCLRAWLAGWAVAYFPGTVVLHDERRITRRLSPLTLKHATSLTRYYARHRYILSRRRLYRRLGTSISDVDLPSLREAS
jgi:GT2 family glycosyltransferase